MDELHNSLGHERECVVACPYLTSILYMLQYILHYIYSTMLHYSTGSRLCCVTLCYTMLYYMYAIHLP